MEDLDLNNLRYRISMQLLCFLLSLINYVAGDDNATVMTGPGCPSTSVSLRVATREYKHADLIGLNQSAIDIPKHDVTVIFKVVGLIGPYSMAMDTLSKSNYSRSMPEVSLELNYVARVLDLNYQEQSSCLRGANYSFYFIKTGSRRWYDDLQAEAISLQATTELPVFFPVTVVAIHFLAW